MELITLFRKLTNDYNIAIWFENRWIYQIGDDIFTCDYDTNELEALREALSKFRYIYDHIIGDLLTEASQFHIDCQYIEAIEKYSLVIELIKGPYSISDSDWDLKDAYYGIAKCYEMLGDYASALINLCKVTEINDEFYPKCCSYEKGILLLGYAVSELKKCKNTEHVRFTEQCFENIQSTIRYIETLFSEDTLNDAYQKKSE